MNLNNRFKELLVSKKVIPFIGAGFSIPSGAPSWDKLVKIVAEKILDGDDSLRAFNILQNHIGAIDISELFDSLNLSELPFFETVKSILANDRLKPNEYHSKLLSLEVDTIITTNWDLLIEKSALNIERPYDKILNDQGVVLYDPGERLQIIKLHGDIETLNAPYNLVYKKSHFESYWHHRRILESLFITLASTKTFLFMGYGFGDPNIRSTLGLLKRTGSLSREHYALAYGKDERMRQFWHDLGVKVIEAPEFDHRLNNFEESTKKFLDILINETKSISITNLERAQLINREIKIVANNGSPAPVFRMYGSLGWLSNPAPSGGEPIYGSLEQDTQERIMTESLYEILSAHPKAKVKCILHFHTESLIIKYPVEHIVERLKQLLISIESFPTQVQLVHHPVTISYNQMIIDEHVYISGNKTPKNAGIKNVTLIRDHSTIKNEILKFEEDFKNLLNENVGEAEDLKIFSSDNNLEYVKYKINAEIKRLEQKYIDDDFDLLAKAITFAVIEHHKQGQTREDKITPYGEHLVRVVDKLRTIGRVINYKVLAAAALHDILEDTKWTKDEITSLFGDEVSKLVVNMTHKKSDNQDAYIEQLSHAGDNTKAIKLADRLDNVQDLIRYQPKLFGDQSPIDYIENSQKILTTCAQGNLRLANELSTTISKAIKIFSI